MIFRYTLYIAGQKAWQFIYVLICILISSFWLKFKIPNLKFHCMLFLVLLDSSVIVCLRRQGRENCSKKKSSKKHLLFCYLWSNVAFIYVCQDKFHIWVPFHFVMLESDNIFIYTHIHILEYCANILFKCLRISTLPYVKYDWHILCSSSIWHGFSDMFYFR